MGTGDVYNGQATWRTATTDWPGAGFLPDRTLLLAVAADMPSPRANGTTCREPFHRDDSPTSALRLHPWGMPGTFGAPVSLDLSEASTNITANLALSLLHLPISIFRLAFRTLDFYNPFKAFVGQTFFALTPIWTARRPYRWQEPCTRLQIRCFEDTWVTLVSTPSALLLAASQVLPPGPLAPHTLSNTLPYLGTPWPPPPSGRGPCQPGPRRHGAAGGRAGRGLGAQAGTAGESGNVAVLRPFLASGAGAPLGLTKAYPDPDGVIRRHRPVQRLGDGGVLKSMGLGVLKSLQPQVWEDRVRAAAASPRRELVAWRKVSQEYPPVPFADVFDLA